MKTKLFIFLAIFTVLFLTACTSSKTPTGNAIVDSKDSISIPLSDLSDKVEFYEFDSNGIKVNYFVVKGSDGKPRTAFDACDVCGGYKGYSQRGKDVVCNNCGRVFKIDDIGSKNGPGGCWPSFLDHEIEGDNILIKESELEKGVFRFR